MFSDPGRCSACTIIPLFRRHFQISSASSDRTGEWVPPILLVNASLWCCPGEKGWRPHEGWVQLISGLEMLPGAPDNWCDGTSPQESKGPLWSLLRSSLPNLVWMHWMPSRNPSEGCVVTSHCADCIGLPTTPSPHSSGGPQQYLNRMSGRFVGLWAGLFSGCSSKGGLAGLLGELPPLTPRDGLGLRLSSALSPSSPSQSVSANVVCSEVERNPQCLGIQWEPQELNSLSRHRDTLLEIGDEPQWNQEFHCCCQLLFHSVFVLVHDQHVVEVEYQSDSQLPHCGYHWLHDLGENVGGTAQSKGEGLELPFLAFPTES